MAAELNRCSEPWIVNRISINKKWLPFISCQQASLDHKERPQLHHFACQGTTMNR